MAAFSNITNIKRQVTRKVVGPTPVGNQEIEDYHQKLLNISSALEESSKSIVASESSWAKMYTQMQSHFENFVNVYPDDDSYRKIFMQGAEKAAEVAKNYQDRGQTSPARKIDFKVQEYLIEINAVLKELKAVENAHADYLAGVDKISSLQKARRTDPEKITKWEDSTETYKQTYQALSDDLLNKMKRIYSKRKIIFNAAFVAYWRDQMACLAMLESEMKETSDYATKHEAEFLNMDVSRLC